MVAVCRSRSELQVSLPHDRTRAVVMTMGALHAGHAALIDAARGEAGPDGHVTVTVFVNPLQFGPGEDFERYPRTPQADIDLAAAHGADAVFLPGVAEVYGSASGPDPDGITIQPGRLGRQLEGQPRPSHFAGVLTVVMTLLQITRADVALFGEKDYQQLALIRGMAERFCLPARIIGVPTVRDHDGLALSSRNAYLSERDRSRALAIPRALSAARDTAQAGGSAETVLAAARGVLAEAGLQPDYVALTGPDLQPPPRSGQARLLVAVPVGGTRLLDNTAILLRGAA